MTQLFLCIDNNYIYHMELEYTLNCKNQKQNQILFTSLGNQHLRIRVVSFDEGTSLPEDATFEQIQEKIQIHEFQILKDSDSKKLFQFLRSFSQIKNELEKAQNWQFNKRDKQFKIKRGANDLKTATLRQAKIRQLYPLDKFRKLIENQFKIKLVPRQKEEEKVTSYPDGDENKVDDAKKIQQQEKTYEFIKSDTFGIDAFDINQGTITKNNKGNHQNKQRYVFGKNLLTYQNYFTIQISKLSKQDRDPAIWVGFVDINEKDKDHMEQNMENVVAMSDQKKFYINGLYHIRNQVHEDKPWITQQEVEQNPDIQYEYLAHEFREGDQITVTVNKNIGEVTWTNKNGEELGKCYTKKLQDPQLEWVPFVELWKTGDAIVWIK